MKQSRTWHVKMLGMILPWIAVQLVAAARPPEKSQLVSPCEWCPPGPCPRLSDIQDAKIAKSFNISRFEGLWYEVAYKDITQPRICKCTTSNKQRINDCQLLDRFSIQCAGKKYDEDLLFNLTEHNGFFLGHWTNLPGVDKITFPDLVVDVGEGDDEDESYRWAIEFQCVNGPRDNIVFFGINFYARNVTDGGLLNEMEMSARAHNLSGFMDFKRSMHTVDHPGCTYTAFA